MSSELIDIRVFMFIVLIVHKSLLRAVGDWTRGSLAGLLALFDERPT